MIVVCCYVAVVIMFVALQRSLMYPAMTSAAPLVAEDYRFHGVALADAVTKTSDGITLHGWYARPEGDPPEPRPLILFFHGNGGNRIHRIDDIDLLVGLGAEVLVFDYRGYAENAGTPSEAGLKLDARAAWEYAIQELGVPSDRIVLFGESLGGGVAVSLAAETCAAGTPPAGLILRSTFSSMTDAASYHYPWLPIRLALLDRYDSMSRIGQVTCPLLMLHGDRDPVVPDVLGRRLFDAAPAESAGGVAKQFVVLEGAGHNDVLDMSRGEIRAAIGNSLRDLSFSRSH